MTAEQLNIKLKLDISDLKSGIDKAKKSISGMNDEVKKGLPKISSEGKKAKDSLEGVSKASEDVRKDLQKVGTEATNSLSKIKQMLTGIKSSGGLNESFKVDTSGANSANTSLEEMQSTMQMILGMNFFDLISERWDKISTHAKKATKGMVDGFKGIKDAIMDIKDNYDMMGYTLKETGEIFLSDIKNVGKAFLNAGKAAAAALGPILALAAAVAAVAGASIANNTKQFREEQSKLISSFQTSGATAEQAGLAYNNLFRFLGDSARSVEAANHIAKLTNNTENLAEWTKICQGIYATFGDSLPIEGLTESANETARVGKVTGTLADALNWAGVNEDAFNASLAQTNTLSEREALIRSTLNGLYENAANVYEKNNKKIIEQNEAQARLNATMARIGHYTQVLVTAWINLKNVVMRVLSPAIVYLSILFTELLNMISAAVRWIGVFFGIDFGTDKISGAVADVNTSLGGVAGTTGTVTDNLGEATKAAEKLRRATMGFDELNILPGKDSAAGSAGSSDISGGGASGGGFDIPKLPIEELGLDKWQEKIDKWGDIVRAVLPPALIAVGGIGMVLCLLGGNIPGAILFGTMAGIGLAGMFGGEGGFQGYIDNFGTACNGLLVPAAIGAGAVGMVIFALMGNWLGAIACAGLAGLGLYASTQNGFKGLEDGFAQTVARIVSTALSVIGVLGVLICLLTGNIPGALIFGAMAGIGLTGLATTGGFGWILDGIKSAWDSIANWFNTNVKPIFTLSWWLDFLFPVAYAADGTGESTSQAFSKKWENLKNWFKTNVAPKFTKAYWLEKFDSIKSSANEKLEATKTSITTKWSNVKNWFKENVATKFTKKYWADKFDTIRSNASEKLDSTKNAISTKWAGIKNWFKESVAPKFTKKYWSDKFNTMKTSASDKVGSTVSAFKDGWSGLKKWFTTNVSPKFTTSYWKGKFDTIRSGAKAAFNGIISVVESAVNGIIKKINTLSWKIPDWVPKFGGDKFGFNFKTISIPRLATGGIVTNSTLANIGERGAEAVLPLTGSQSTAWMDMLANKIAERSGGNTPAKIILQVDGRQLGWAAIDNINDITKQSGNLQLVLG